MLILALVIALLAFSLMAIQQYLHHTSSSRPGRSPWRSRATPLDAEEQRMHQWLESGEEGELGGGAEEA